MVPKSQGQGTSREGQLHPGEQDLTCSGEREAGTTRGGYGRRKWQGKWTIEMIYSQRNIPQRKLLYLPQSLKAQTCAIAFWFLQWVPKASSSCQPRVKSAFGAISGGSQKLSLYKMAIIILTNYMEVYKDQILSLTHLIFKYWLSFCYASGVVWMHQCAGEF